MANKTKDLLPVNLQGDKNLEGLCEAADKVFSVESELNAVLVYLIDNVPANILPFLAWQFHVEGWKLAKTEAEKRGLIKGAIELHRYKGTPWAIKKVFEILNLNAEIEEWFQYSGTAYKFKVLLKSVIQDEETYKKLVDLIGEYKNVRSWLEAIGIHREYTASVYCGIAAKDGKYCTIGLHLRTDVEGINIYTALAQRIAMTNSIGVHNPIVNVSQSAYSMAGVVREAKSWVISAAPY
ncbi:MAG: phage tail protein I [Nitrospinae bacterium]|nr:phage tail protein I [Nitrospinota bacterium]